MAAVFAYLGRFLVIIVGYALASLAASVFLNILLLGVINLRPEESLPVVVGSMLVSVPFITLFIAYFAFIPAVPVILLGEVLGKRDWLFYAVGGAIVGTVVIAFMSGTAQTGEDSVSHPGLALALIADGMFGAIAYWLVAGRSAGSWRTVRQPADAADGRGT